MLVVPLVSKSPGCVIRLSQQVEVCISGISSHLVKAIHSKLSFISGPLRNWVCFVSRALLSPFRTTTSFL